MKLTFFQKLKQIRPEGVLCCNCGCENHFYDGAGWFYSTLLPPNDDKRGPVCLECRNEIKGNRPIIGEFREEEAYYLEQEMKERFK